MSIKLQIQLRFRGRLSDYLEANCNFRDYYFHDADKFKSINLPASIHLLHPTEDEIDDAIAVFCRDGYNSIHIYL